jgi:hypothetical protein
MTLAQKVLNNQSTFNKLFDLTKVELIKLVRGLCKDHTRYDELLTTVLDNCTVIKTISDDIPTLITLNGPCPETHYDELQIIINPLSISYRTEHSSNFKILDFTSDILG